MVGVNANLDITYDDFDELKEHPLAAAGMVNFGELLESGIGKTKEDILSIKEKKEEIAGKKDM